MAKGTYADVIFSSNSNKKFDDIIKSFGLKKDFIDEYHCTLTYSKKYLPYLKTSKGTKQDKTGNAKNDINKLVKIKGFGHFDTDDGKNLHVELECKWCETQFDRAIRSGATTDYPNYKAHVTLMYNCKDFTLDPKSEVYKKWIGETIEITEERISPLNNNWVEDSLLTENVELIQNPSHYELNEIIKHLRNNNSHKNKLLNDPKKLKTRIKKLEKVKNDKSRKMIKTDLREELIVKSSSKTSLDDDDKYNIITINTLKQKFNLKKLKSVGEGYTTFVFNDPIDKSKVLCFTLDEDKIKWMQTNKKLFKFTMIDELPYNKTNKLYIYSMVNIKKTFDNDKMSKYNKRLIWDEVVMPFVNLRNKKSFHGVTVADIDHIMYTITNNELLDILKLLKKTFSNDKTLDLHSGQWGENTAGNIILFDPIISQKVLNQLDDFNNLELTTKFALFMDQLLDKSDNAYINKIKNILRKG